MKKRLVVLLILSILMLSIIVSSLSYSREVAFASLNQKRVIVVLKDKQKQGLGEDKDAKRSMISEQQQKFVVKQGQKSFLLNAEHDFRIIRQYNGINAMAVEVSEERLEKIMEDPDVLGVYADQDIYASLDVSASVINATKAWRLVYNNSNITGSGQTVCVIDTGIDYTHNSLGDCSNTSFLNGQCEKVIAGYDFVNNDNDAMDDNGHGTHCAGIIASNHPSYRGIAPDSKLVAIKVLNSAGSGSTSDLISGIEWCTHNASRYNITVISMSLGTETTYTNYCDSEEAALTTAINNAIINNISVVAAAGNDYSATGIELPACIKNVTSVGATNNDDTLASYTNRNNITDLMAPGTSISSLYPTDTTAQLSGTSMATPHVSAAFALIRQYKQLESNINLTPAQIQSALNSSGKRINDSCDTCSNLTFSRINIFDAIKSLDTAAPDIIFVNSTPTDGGITTKDYAFINVTSSEVLSTSLIEWNNTNYTMNGSYTKWFSNMTNASGNISYRVYGNDSSNNMGFTGQRSVLLKANTLPEVINVSITCSDQRNRTNGSLTASWVFYDADNNEEQGNQTFWFVNSTLINAFNNITAINSTNTSKNQNWTLSVRVFDGANWSTWQNSSVLTIQNTEPVLAAISNISVNETNYVNITANASDQDNENLSYAINDSRFSQNNNLFSWKTNISDSGSVIVNVSVSDGSEQDWKQVTITINNALDTDNDGLIDFEDSDDDNDGINDSFDFIKGNVSNINSSISGLAITFNGSDNATNQFNATYFVQILNSTEVLVEFNISLSNETMLDISNMTIEKDNTNTGSLMVYGISLPQSSTKNIFVDNITPAQGMCVKDTHSSSLDAFSQDCKGAYESFVACPGSINQYSCSINGTRFKLSGLNHSSAKQANDTAPPLITRISTSTSGTAITLSIVTDENSSCRYASSNNTYSGMSSMTSTNGFSHSNSITYSSTSSGTYYARCNDTFGNVMDYSNTTPFSITIVTGQTISTEGGGGGGGGGKAIAGNATNITKAGINASNETLINVSSANITNASIEQPANIANMSLEEPMQIPAAQMNEKIKLAYLGVILTLLSLLLLIIIVIRTRKPASRKLKPKSKKLKPKIKLQ